ncbi:MAG: ABC transporter permease [Trueperaceae bacterium]
MNERVAVALMAVLGMAGFLLAPWAALNREIGARSSVLLLPGRVYDFTGRTAPVPVGGLEVVLTLGLLAFLVLIVSSLVSGRRRFLAWLAAGVVLLASTAWGLQNVGEAVSHARKAAFIEEVQQAIENPRGNRDLDVLSQVVAGAEERSLAELRTDSEAAGLNVRRLPYTRSGMGLAAFFSVIFGLAAILLGLRILPGASRVIDRLLGAVAVPAMSIILALLASAVVVLLLQPTPLGSDVEVAGPLMGLAGRLDTLWYAYLTLFADSLGTLAGFLESLKFTTPLIFTGLAVAFGFRAGLFNIGAPGQMILGALGAAGVAVYMPGPALLVMPLAVVSAALFGGLWGALPGWLKARFGANEVINTILLNYIAASMLLFLLSDRPTFAAPALSIIRMLLPATLLILVALLIPPLRRLMGRRPRLSFTVVGMVLLVALVAVAAPVANDPAVIVDLPFKAPGSEPKSYPLQPEGRIPQLPALLGIDLQESPGVNEVAVDLAAWLAPLVALLMLWLAPRLGVRRLMMRFLLAVACWGLSYVLLTLVGLGSVEVLMPPTNLNLSFILALLAALFMQILLWRTKWGYDLRAVGVSPKAAEYGGAHIGRNVILAMTISGAFAGLTATHYVLGGALDEYSLRQSLPTGDGFDGIAVALLGANTPLGVVLAAFLFGVLKNGGSVLNITFGNLTRDVVSMILALVVLFIAARGFLPERLANPLRRRTALYEEEDPTLTSPIDPPGKPVRSEEA